MSVLLLIWVWIGATVFVGACGWRAWRYVSAPVHLRWDLYPVAHEPAARRAYGGSYLEEREWWTKPRHRSLGGEIAAMLAEILVLHGVWVNNRRLFWGSLPFHWGVYLLIATTAGMALSAAGLGDERHASWLALPAAAGGLLVAMGGLRLLYLRSTDRGLRRYTTAADRLNLLVFAVLGALSGAVALVPGGMAGATQAVASLMRLDAPDVTPLLAAQMSLAGLVLVYLPFSRMVHFFAKYFLYHDVRWDDRPVERGSAMERRLRAALDFGVTWSADHVGARSWAEAATAPPPPARHGEPR